MSFPPEMLSPPNRVYYTYIQDVNNNRHIGMTNLMRRELGRQGDVTYTHGVPEDLLAFCKVYEASERQTGSGRQERQGQQWRNSATIIYWILFIA